MSVYSENKALMKEFFILPKQLLAMPQRHKRIDYEGVTVIESCHYEQEMSGSALNTEFEMIHSLSGRLEFRNGHIKGVLEAGETGLINKSVFFDYW
ncbi:MAG: hypothetical protein MUE85_12525 [Microscillaceae bacterium]|nr:hypothetical protein [Microscillaceae bacterium]